MAQEEMLGWMGGPYPKMGPGAGESDHCFSILDT